MARIIPIELDDSKPWSAGEAASLPAAPSRQPGSALARIFAAIGRRFTRRAAIHQLGMLDRRLLKDIGIEREEIEAFVDTMLEEMEGPGNTRAARPPIALVPDRR